MLSASCCACCLFVASFPWCCMFAMDAQRWEQVELSVPIMVCNGASFASIMSSACLGTGVVMWWSCTTKVDFADLVMSLTGQYWHYMSTALAHSGAVWRLSLQFFFRLCDLLRFTPNCLWQQNLAASRFCTGMVSQHAWQRLEQFVATFMAACVKGPDPLPGNSTQWILCWSIVAYCGWDSLPMVMAIAMKVTNAAVGSRSVTNWVDPRQNYSLISFCCTASLTASDGLSQASW